METAKADQKKQAVPLIDIGANLLDDMFQGVYRGKRAHPADFELMLQRAKAAGV